MAMTNERFSESEGRQRDIQSEEQRENFIK